MTGSGALAGIRVVDFSTLLPGPMATLFLADAGAEVIKVERPETGDEMRSYEPRWGADSANFHLLNRGKKSVALDLKSPEDRARLQPLLETADIVVEQFRPGVMARLGLSYDDVRAINADIIYCAITGYGQSGPKQARAGHDINFQADAGLLSLGYGSAETPTLSPSLTADIGGGTYPALVNILLALLRRERTGEGTFLDIAMAENVFPFSYWAQATGEASGNWPGNGDALTTGGTCRYGLYPTADGRLIAVGAIEQKFWDALCDAIGLEPALRDDRRAPAATKARVKELLASKPASHWADILATADCCCSVVRSLEEAMTDSHFAARQVFARRVSLPNGRETMALPTPIVPALRGDGPDVAAAPALGGQTREFLA